DAIDHAPYVSCQNFDVCPFLQRFLQIIVNDIDTRTHNERAQYIYLYVTQPQALLQLLTFKSENFEIRLWRSNGVAFHPKSFIFKHREEGAIIVGSSNLSRSALTSGIEWNMRMKRKASMPTFDKAIHQFIELFYAAETMEINHESIKTYDKEYHDFHANHADLINTWTKREEIELTLPTVEQEPQPEMLQETTTYET